MSLGQEDNRREAILESRAVGTDAIESLLQFTTTLS